VTIVASHVRLAKQAYDNQGRMKPRLASRYWRQFSGARRVVDWGCGVGKFGRHRPQGVEVPGIDKDPGAVGKACEFEQAICLDLERASLPDEDGSFDAVLAKDVLEHMCRPERVVQEVHRVLRLGALLVASVVVAAPKRVWADYTHVRGFTPQAARLLLEDTGFHVEAVWKTGGVPLSRRLRIIRFVPALLWLPPLGWLRSSSWELKARR
jgi:SAM-dependent methyltransferase